jgi:hypothetical protein
MTPLDYFNEILYRLLITNAKNPFSKQTIQMCDTAASLTSAVVLASSEVLAVFSDNTVVVLHESTF